MKLTFNKELLENLMTVELRDNSTRIVIKRVKGMFPGFYRIGVEGTLLQLSIDFNQYEDDLTRSIRKAGDTDVMKVYDQKGKLIWERKEIVISEDDYINLRYAKMNNYNYVARDEDKEIRCFQSIPRKSKNNYWLGDFDMNICRFEESNKNTLPFIKWEDGEPYKIDDLIELYEGESL